jgi:peptidoglycan/LPS O-acetylase OafA/YrhL
MQSPNRNYVPELDQLRGIAAILVFFYHTVHTGLVTFGQTAWPAANPLNALLIEGHTGVALFMVLSGFILAKGALGSPIRYKQFLTNRLLRIFPLMTFVAAFAVYSNMNVTLHGILSPFLLLANTQPRLMTDITSLSDTFWTISVEFQFYLVAPFLIMFVGRGGLRYVLLFLLFVLIVRAIALYPHIGSSADLFQITYYTIVGRIGQFVVGIALAYGWPTIEKRLQGRRAWGLALALGALAGAAALSMAVNSGGGVFKWQNWMFVYHDVEALIWAILIAGYILARPLSILPPLAQAANGVGIISFSIYILHWPIEQVFWKAVAALGLGPGSASVLTMTGYAALLLPIVLAVSWLSYMVVESPFLAMRRRYVVTAHAPAGIRAPSSARCGAPSA